MSYRGKPFVARGAFTLIEFLIVISCLSILAMTVYPYVVNARETAEESGARDQLASIRKQIQLYRGQHDGKLPDLVTSWDALTRPHAFGGRTVGPYLPSVPKNQGLLNVMDGVETSTDLPGKFAYVYDYRGGAGTGKIWATKSGGKKLAKW